MNYIGKFVNLLFFGSESNKSFMDISIIITSYKSKGLTLNCIKSIREADFGDLKYEIIVIDNDSGDSLGEILKWQYPEVIFIQNNVNVGMGAGNNTGFRRSQGKYVVFMNPDTIAFNDTFKILYQYMEENYEVGMVGPKQLYPDKTMQKTCFRWHYLMTFFYRRTFLGRMRFAQNDLDRFVMKDYNHIDIKEVDWVLGSFMFCRREMFAKIGMFDERFFLYFEDTDLCRSFWKAGYKVVYNPDAKIIHNHSRQSAKIPWYKFIFNKAARFHFVSWLKYLKKWGINKR